MLLLKNQHLSKKYLNRKLIHLGILTKTLYKKTTRTKELGAQAKAIFRSLTKETHQPLRKDKKRSYKAKEVIRGNATTLISIGNASFMKQH